MVGVDQIVVFTAFIYYGGPYKNSRYASKTVRVRVRDRVSVYSLPDDGVLSPY